MRTAADAAVTRNTDQAVVAFEVDELDAASQCGWSVIVTGRAAVVRDAQAIARYRALPLVPWVPGRHDQFLTITTELVEGLQIQRERSASPAG